MADSLGTARVQSDMCHLRQESKRTEVFLYTGIVYSLAIVFVVLRIAGKAASQRMAWDDLIVVIALCLTAIPVGCVLAMTKIGFGEHLWNLEDGKLLPILRYCESTQVQSTRVLLTRSVYISCSTYVLVLGLIKVSILLFYLEIFQTRRFKISAYIVLAYIIVNSIIIIFLTMFACAPVSSFWDRDIKGKCMDVQALAYANSASAIVQDIILLILPLVFIRNLRVKRFRKIGVAVMFCFGTFGCIATIVRLQSLLTFKISLDPSWDYVPITIWTELELVACFVCVSLPSIRVLVVRILPTRVKGFLSHITHQSSRSNPTPKPDAPAREWKKPASWINITHEPAGDSEHGSGGAQSFGSLWSRHSNTPSTNRHMRQDSKSLESAMNNYTEVGVAVTHLPYEQEQVELLKLEKPKKAVRQSLRSDGSCDSPITAPSTMNNIGCLPERTYSQVNVANSHRGLEWKGSKDDKV